MKKSVDILLPCYNEQHVLKECIQRIKKVIKKDQRFNYSIVVCDNNSKDKSYEIAKKYANVIVEKEKGYGATLLNGINSSKADYIVMLDCDLSYDETDIPKFVEELDNGYDFVIGNRYKGGMEKGAMSWSHKIGVKFLTEYANLLFHTNSHDYHSGLRAFKRKEILKCELNSSGFEFASEMVIKAKLSGLKMKEVPTKLFCDGREGKSHLRTIRDGFRHLNLINKIKFQTSILFRYISIYIILILSMFSLLLIASSIPQKYVEENAYKSMDFLEEFYFKKLEKRKYFYFEKCGDIRNVAMAYSMDSKKVVSSAIRMSYYENVDRLKMLKKTIKEKEGDLVDYSRYWQGQAAYSKLMLLIMPVGYPLYIIQLIILTILFLYLSYKLFKKDKLLCLSFILANIGIVSLFTAFSVQYFFAILLSYIFSILVIKLYDKKSKYIGVMFAIDGMLTCFFDFLTCETLALTMPLFIYSYLSIKENKKQVWKEIIKYIFIWGLFYGIGFITKWLISMLYFGFDYIKVIFSKAMNRVGAGSSTYYTNGFKAILLAFENILPFSFNKYGMVMLIGLTVISIILQLFFEKKYSPLLLIISIPFIRFLLIVSHSYRFGYFTYRAYAVLLIYIILFIIKGIKKVFSKY